jgi:hypothetical protein
MRLQKPFDVSAPDFHPMAPLRVVSFHGVQNGARRQRDLIYDPNLRIKEKPPIFSGDFECGNLGQVFMTGVRQYEIHILPDPTAYYSALWYFFKVSDIPPGEYQFSIYGFFRDAHLHGIGVQPVALSALGTDKGIGWQRFGQDINFWCCKRGLENEYALSFRFHVAETDTIYFAYLYPYSYTRLRDWIMNQPLGVEFSTVCRSHGGVDVPAFFWDADFQRCQNVKNLTIPQHRPGRDYRKPLIVICARHHPGESCASFAMEGFLSALLSESRAGKRLLKSFSFLVIPMMNVDGVICGYYRPTLTGYDMNRSWTFPKRKDNPVEFATVCLLDRLVKTRQLLFILDFHGHSAQCNAFTYSVWDPLVPYNEYVGLFPRIMAKRCVIFDEEASFSTTPESYSSTMRVALHRRYNIPFAYTLEMSFGGIDIGSRANTQITPLLYRDVGIATVCSLATMLLEQVPLAAMMKAYVPPVFKACGEKSDNEGKS